MSERRPLLLSHGVIESGASWAQAASLLAGRFQVVAHDGRGRGQAPIPEGAFTYADLAEDVEALARARGFDRFFHAGHSMGGRVALEHALAHPHSVRAIAVISARAEAPDAAGRDRLRTQAEKARRLGAGEAIDMWTHPGEAHFARVRQISASNSAEGTAMALEALAAADSLLPRLAELSTPVLVIAGDQDAAYVGSARRMVEAIPRAELRILAGIGHFPNLECPELLAEILGEFFDRHSA